MNPEKNPSSSPDSKQETSQETQAAQTAKLLKIEASIIQQDLAKESDPSKIASLKARLGEILDIQTKNEQALDKKYNVVDFKAAPKETPAGNFDFNNERRGGMIREESNFKPLTGAKTLGGTSKPFNWKDVPDTGDRPPRTLGKETTLDDSKIDFK